MFTEAVTIATLLSRPLGMNLLVGSKVVGFTRSH